MSSVKIRIDPRRRLGTSKMKGVVVVSARIDQDEYDKIVEHCKSEGITMSHYMRECVKIKNKKEKT